MKNSCMILETAHKVFELPSQYALLSGIESLKPIHVRRKVLYQMRCPFRFHAIDCNLLTLSPVPLSSATIVTRSMPWLIPLLIGVIHTSHVLLGQAWRSYRTYIQLGDRRGDKRSSERRVEGGAVSRVSFHVSNDKLEPLKLSP